MHLTLIGPEPITLAEAKLAARVDDDLVGASSLDGVIQGLITAAREHAEHITGRCYCEQVRRFELRDWPSLDEAFPLCGATACAVSYWDGADWSDLTESGAFVFAPGGIGANGTALAPAVAWPVLGARAIGPRVRVDLTAGPQDADQVPAQVKLYITATVAAWLKTPEAQREGMLTPNPLYARLLDRERLYV